MNLLHTRTIAAKNACFRLQYASNLHITNHEKPLFPLFIQPTAPHLAIVGNVGNPKSDYYRSFFAWASSRWKSIIYVPGEVEHKVMESPYEIIKHHQNIFMLDKHNQFYIYEPYKLALWIPTETSSYRQLFIFTYGCEERRTYLEHHGTIYSHGLNGENKKIFINSRGCNESPDVGFSTEAVMSFSSKNMN